MPVERPTAAGPLHSLGPAPNIVVVRASRLGDLVCALPALHDLKCALPDCRLNLVALPMLVPLAQRVPFVDRVLPFPGFPGMADQLFAPSHALAFFAAMQDEQFDLAVQMHGTGAYSNPLTLMLGARMTAGFVGHDGYRALLDTALEMPEGLSEVARCRALTRLLGAPEEHLGQPFRLTGCDLTAALAVLGDNPLPWIGVHPFARDVNKAWPIKRFLDVSRQLAAELGGTVFVLGDTGDLIEQVPALGSAQVREGRNPLVDLRRATSLPELAAVIAALDLFIGNDSGPSHLAYAMDVPSVTVFGGTDPVRWGPQNCPGITKDLHAVAATEAVCRPCEPRDCRCGAKCLEDLETDVVLELALAVSAASLRHARTALPDTVSRPQKRVEPAITGGL